MGGEPFSNPPGRPPPSPPAAARHMRCLRERLGDLVEALAQFVLGLGVAVAARLEQQLAEDLLQLGEADPALRPRWPRHPESHRRSIHLLSLPVVAVGYAQ